MNGKSGMMVLKAGLSTGKNIPLRVMAWALAGGAGVGSECISSS
jgi:hypothetical protein